MRRFICGWAAGAVGCLLMAGCATPGRGPAAVVSPAQEDRVAAAHAHYAQGTIYDMDAEPEKAMEEFTRAALADPSNEALVLELTQRYFQAQQPERALEMLKRASEVPGASGEVFAELGEVYARTGKQAEAVAATQKAIKLDPKSLTGYQNLFVISLQRKKYPEALKSLDQAAAVPGTGSEFLIDLGALYAALEFQAPALKAAATNNGLAVLKRAQAMDATNELSLKLADAYSLLGDSTNAAQIYLQLLAKYGELPSSRANLHAKLADIYLRGGDTGKAEDQMKAILRDDPANPQVYYFLGSLAFEEQRLPQAAEYFQKAVVLKEDFEQAYYKLAAAQIGQKLPQDALATLRRAAARFPSNFINEFYTAKAYSEAKDYTNAVTHFNAAETLARTTRTNGLDGFFYFEVGAANERKGDFDQAAVYFEKSLKLSPDMPEALNYYGYMLADRGIKLDKARELIEKAVKLDPNNAAFIDSLGWVLYRQGKLEEGLTQIQKAIELMRAEPDATLYEHLGDIYAAMKQTDKAREAWEKSISIEPTDAVRKKLDQLGGH